jgi:Carboxypeptidase regulatory-like domain/TonB dependent receptor-like, beta-barrel
MRSSSRPVQRPVLSFVTNVPHFMAAMIAVFFVCLPLLSQTNQGRISGAVFDQTGGVIAGATVTVTDVARGIARPLTVDSAGEYSASSLLPGTYTVRGEAKGFRAVEHTGILVQVGEDIRVDLTLQAGEQTQTVTVTAEIPQLETTNSTLGGALANQTINDLPLNGRDFTSLLALRPGITLYPGGGNYSESTNALRTNWNSLLLDGSLDFNPLSGASVINFQFMAGGSSSSLPVDSIQEFNTQQNPKAEYGWAPGAVVNIGLKSGTNSLHGTAYAYGRDDALDARNYYNQAPSPKTPVALEQFGGTAGGAIIKDKLFWFASYDGQRYTVGNLYVASTPVTTSIGNPNSSIPDACNALKAAGKTINPLSAQLAGLNTATCVVSPSSSTLENLFPFNNGTNPGGPTAITPNLTNNNPENNGVGKLDYHINDHHQLSASYYYGGLNSLWVTSPDQLTPAWQNIIQARVDAYSANWTWTPNSRWVNELRAGFHQNEQVNLSNDGTVDPAAPWPTGYGINTGVTNPSFFGFPYLQITGFSNFALGHGRHTSDWSGGEGDIVDDVSFLRGNHSFKFGGEFVYGVLNQYSYNSAEGQIKFGSLQNYLQGIPSNGAILAGAPATYGRDRAFSGFFQDDWRLTTRVTLNLGLRYEYVTPPWEPQHLYSGFQPNLGLVQAGVQVPSLIHGDRKLFSPRAGLAWDVNGNGKTVVRAGANLMYPSLLFPVEVGNIAAPFGADIVVNGVTTPGSQAGSFSASYTGAQLNWNTTGPVFPITSALAANRLRCGDGVGTDPKPCTTSAVDPNIVDPRIISWNLDVQKALTKSLTLDIGYVGNHGSGLNALVDENQPPIGAGWFGPHNAAAACLASAPTYNNCNVSNADITAAQPFHTQYPYLSFIAESRNRDISNYNGLQVTLTQRSYHGLSILAGYTYSHSLDDMSGEGSGSWKPQDAALPQLEYGNSDYDLRHRFTLTLNYAIPGKKSFGQLLEGWQLNSVVTLQSGLPWGIMDNSDDFTGTGEFKDNTPMRWDYTGNPSAFTSGNFKIPCFGPATGCTPFPVVGGVPQPPAACMSAAQANGQLAVASLMNLGCYVENGGVLTPPAYGSIGTMGRNIFRDGGFRNWDFSVFKNWKVKERLTAQFRVEFFNVLNHPNFANPYGARSGYDNNDPSNGYGMGCGCITPDAATGNFVLGSGGARDIQLGLKLLF